MQLTYLNERDFIKNKDYNITLEKDYFACTKLFNQVSIIWSKNKAIYIAYGKRTDTDSEPKWFITSESSRAYIYENTWQIQHPIIACKTPLNHNEVALINTLQPYSPQ